MGTPSSRRLGSAPQLLETEPTAADPESTEAGLVGGRVA
jgi:hypothetical protein